jgi:hypothetical protein
VAGDLPAAVSVAPAPSHPSAAAVSLPAAAPSPRGSAAIPLTPVSAPRPAPSNRPTVATASPGSESHSAPAPSPAKRWWCTGCLTANPADATFCQHCGRISPMVEDELAAAQDRLVLNGVRALRAGDEETAHRWFMQATDATPRNERAWHWRARTAPTLNELIFCLEQTLALDPSNERAERDLGIAQIRWERQEALAAPLPPTEPAPVGPTYQQRLIEFARQVALELASIPCFVLGLLWLGGPILGALTGLNLTVPTNLLPQLQLPNWTLTVPPSVPDFGLLPAHLRVGSLAPVLLALWYLGAAFPIAEGRRLGRGLALASAVAAFALLPTIAANAPVYELNAGLLLLFALIGTSHPDLE